MSEDSPVRITTPDRRVRVFVSSTLGELAAERQRARAAITGLRLTPIMFELGARPHPPRQLYRAYLAQSDVFVGIYWQRYGWVAPGETVSGLEDEYSLSGDRPKLIYVKTPAPEREPRLAELLKRVQTDDRASYKSFSDGDQLGELLADDLAVLLTERFTMPAAAEPAGLSPGRLPTPLTPMIGREADRAAVLAQFRAGSRLVTVTGPGGIGKTRLALDVAADLPGTGFDGAWFVDLAAVAAPADVLPAIAATLEVRTPGSRPVLDVLADRLAGRRALLLLDNVEHVLAAATDIGRLLTAVPDLGVLATSRSLLHLRGEHEVALAPLTLPGSARADVGDVAASSAVRLFVARATESQPGFALTPENASAVAEICRRLDGIPLAIELAAARLRLLTPAALVDRLENRLDLPGAQVDLPERQRTLRATVDWSYRLLGERERALLGRLSVFAGGWTVETAEALGADGDVLATLSSLVDSSLVTVDDTASAGPRFRMLGVVRDYAAEKLAAGGDRDAAWTRLLDVVADFVERADAGLRTSYRAWAARIDDELDNIRAAWGRATEAGDAPTAFRIAAPLAYYYWSRNLLVEGLPLLERLSALPSVAQLDAPARGRLCWARGTAKIVVGQAAAARPLLEEALRVGRELEDAELVSRAMTSLSYLVEGDEIVPVRTALEEGAAHFRRSGDRVNEAYGLQALGQLVMRSGDLDAAAAVFDRCRVIAEEMDNDHLQAVALHQSGFTALLQGEPERARGLFEASVAANAHLLDQEGLAVCLDGFAAVAGAERRFVEAARLHSAAARLRAGLGISLWRVLQPIHDEGTAAARAALGDPRFEQERRAGAAMGASEALAYAREAVAGHTVAPRGAADGIDDPRVSRP